MEAACTTEPGSAESRLAFQWHRGSEGRAGLVPGFRGPQTLDGVDGVADRAPFLKAGGKEARVRGASQLHHPIAISFVAERRPLCEEGWLPG